MPANAGGIELPMHKTVWVEDADLEDSFKEQHAKHHGKGGLWPLLALSFSALGVVYGDIGTSPLYVFAAIFPDGAPADDANRVLGAFSMVFWTLTTVVLVKYVALMLAADDDGEGGVIALYSIAKRAAGVPTLTSVARPGDEDLRPAPPALGRAAAAVRARLHASRPLQLALLALVLLATNMIISDGVLTPAISVISAVEGIAFNAGLSQTDVVGITVAILVVLFCVQPFGTARVAAVFAPVILLWFAALAAIGAYNLAAHGAGALKGLSPHYIYYYWSGDAGWAWRRLGAVMLSVTGAEALYADMGHFSAPSIRLSFLAVVYPALTLTYAGQAAYIVAHPASAGQAFWASIPGAVYIPMVVLATAAAIIASQALITGAFSITRQGIAIRCFPRLTVRHTSAAAEGQIYIPQINWALLVGCIIIVAAFRSSAAIGNAYGLAIVVVMVLDTFFLALVMLIDWNWHPAGVAAFCTLYTIIFGAFLSSNLEKIPQGAWFSLVLAGILSAVAFVYWWGRATKAEHIRANIIPFCDLFEPAKGEGSGPAAAPLALRSTSAAPVAADPAALSDPAANADTTVRLHSGIKPLRLVGTKLPVARLPGLGLYYSEALDGVPPVLVRFLSLSPAIHEVVVLVTIRRVPQPAVPPARRLLVRKLEVEGFYHVVSRYGYMEGIDQGPEFARLVVDELLEYLQAGGMDAAEEAAFQMGDFSDLEAGSGGPPTWTGGVRTWGSAMGGRSLTLAARGGGAPQPAASASNSREGSRHGVSLTTAAGQQLLAQIKSRLRGEGLGEPPRAAPVPPPPPPAAALQRPSATTPRLMVTAIEGAGLARVSVASSAAGAGTSRPWVCQPSLFNRARAATGGAADRAITVLKGGADATATVPLPPPPPRPCIHRLSVQFPVEHGADGGGGGGGGVGGGALRRASLTGASPTITVSSIASEALSQRLQEERAKAEEKGDPCASERSLLLAAYSHGVVHLLGRAELRATPGGRGPGAAAKRLIIDGLYSFLVRNSRSASADYRLPSDTLIEMTVKYQV